MIKRSRSKQKSRTSNKEVALIRENTATLYGLYFATSNTDFLLNEKKTRFSVRPDVVVKEDRQTAIFDYSSIKGSEQASIFDGFFRGLQEGTTCAAGVTGCSGATCCGSTLGLAGAVTTTCNFINDVTGIPKTDFADTYTLSKVDVTSKTIVAIKETPITTTTAVQFNGDYFIDLPQWTKTQKNETSTPVKRIINLLSSQSLEHLGIRRGSVLEFKKTKNNNKKFTVVNMYNENGFEILEVDEEVVKEDLTDTQIIVSIYKSEDTQDNPIERQPAAAVVYTTSGGTDCEPPIYGPMPTPQGGAEFRKWLDRDMNCCKCLVYAEGECNNDQCQKCTAWAIWNRRRDRVPGGAVPAYNGREEDSYCDQARMRGRFEGGWGNAKFNSCFCGNTTNPLSRECERKADLICRQIGHSNYRGLPDPTGGANYFWTDGQVPDYMDCNVQAGICKKVTGVCADCGNAFYICKGVPQPCDVLGKKPRTDSDTETDDTPIIPA